MSAKEGNGSMKAGRVLRACVWAVCACGWFWAAPAHAARLRAKTIAAFDQYVAAAEAQSGKELSARRNFLWIETLSEREKDHSKAELHAGQVLTRENDRCGRPACMEIPGGLIHDWSGLVFIPEASIEQVLAILQDYNSDARYFRPQVVKSRLIKRSSEDFQVFLRLHETEIITVVLDTEYDIRYTSIDPTHVCASSLSTRIAEVEGAGTAREHDDVPGEDDGFLWRLDSYWRFEQADGGVYVQCEAISLTRDIPTGLGWLIGPFLERIPAESLRSTLEETRRAVLEKFERKKEEVQ